MHLSRKRTKQLKRLRGHAEELWHEQQQVLERASEVAREASKQVGLLTREEVVPKVRDAYETRLRPGVDRGFEVSRAVAASTKEKLVDGVLPAVAGVIGSALSVLDVAKDHRVRQAIDRISSGKSVVPPKKSGPGVGGFVLIGIGVLAVAGAAYAAWQTFRADDELWIADDEPEVTGTTNPADVPPTPSV